ncbi:HigA family addiction module antitoxin [Nostoc sp. CALU 1950]|uniref:HigA family addiction module antitoxin n=1 Tax=Nostoc sp. CALU 1950 TaxID=3104321 RepID=UPI003EBA2DFF
MNNNRLLNIHPGKILQLEFLEPLNITPYRLSKDIGVTQTRISKILQAKRIITADKALRLSRYFGLEFALVHFQLFGAGSPKGVTTAVPCLPIYAILP